MPELPEVDSARHLVETHCKGAQISSFVTSELGGGPRDGLHDEIVFDQNTGTQMDFNALQGSTLHGIFRQGKQLWMELGGASLLVHFGMTGSFVIKGEPIPQYKSFEIKDGEGKEGGEKEEMKWPPKFTKMLLLFDNGKELAFCDPRRIGRIRLGPSNPRSVEPISKLAPDPMMWNKTIPTDFVRRMRSFSTNVKSVLLDQEKLVSGVGNWVADEVLYQAGIHPATKCKELTVSKATELGQKLIDVCEKACACTCNHISFPEMWLFHYRWGKKKKNAVDKDFHGRSISFETVGGRTSAVVKAVQRKTFVEGDSATSSKYFKEEEEEEQEEVPKTKRRKAPTSKDKDGKGKSAKVKDEAEV